MLPLGILVVLVRTGAEIRIVFGWHSDTYCFHVEGRCAATSVGKRRLMWIDEVSSDFIALLLLPKFVRAYANSPLTFLSISLFINTCAYRGQDFDLRRNFLRTMLGWSETSYFHSIINQPCWELAMTKFCSWIIFHSWQITNIINFFSRRECTY